MSATNKTAVYELPIFLGTDVPSWLTDWNGAMGDIDTAIAAAKAAADAAASTAGTAATDIVTINGQITSLQNTVGTHTTQIGTISGNINTINSLIGNGTPTTTDQTIIGAINELHADQGDLANLTTTDKSSLVAAINEAAQGGGGTETVRYDENTGYIQCKDSQGWFNWKKASRALFNIINDVSLLNVSRGSGATDDPVVTLANDVVTIEATANGYGCAYIAPQAQAYTLHYTGSAEYTRTGSDSVNMGYCDSITDGNPVNPVNIETLTANATPLLFNDKTVNVPAGKYVFISVYSGTFTKLEWNFSELYGV